MTNQNAFRPAVPTSSSRSDTKERIESEKSKRLNPATDSPIGNHVLDGIETVQAAISEQLNEIHIGRSSLNEHDDQYGFDRHYISRPTLSVVIPVFNERDSILGVIESVRSLPIDKQIIVVDDGSTDGTQAVLQSMPFDASIEVFFHTVNQGKGAALQTGFRLAEGNIVIVQDADLEYDPQDILKVIQPILDGQSSVVFGSRYLNDTAHNSSWIHRMGNAALTSLSNLITGQRLTDMETCYKAFRREVLHSINIEQRRFGFEPEITAKISKLGILIPEVAVGYKARSWDEGKKIGLKDLWNAIYCILRYR